MQTMVDDKLRSAREWLLARSAELRERVGRVHDDLRREPTPPPRDAPDAKILRAIDETARAELEQIGHALERVEAGTYGLCEGCGTRIDAGRLHVVPCAAQCSDCAPDA